MKPPEEWNLSHSEEYGLLLLCKLHTFEAVAAERKVAYSTIQAHMNSAYKKMGVTGGRVQAALEYDRWRRGQQ